MNNFKPGDRVHFVDKEYTTNQFTIGEILTVSSISGEYLYFEEKDDYCLRSERVELVKNEIPKIGDEVEIIVKGRVSSITDTHLYLDNNIVGTNRKYETRVTKSAPVFPTESGTIIRSKSSGAFEYVRVADEWVEVNGGEILVITPTFANFEVLFQREK